MTVNSNQLALSAIAAIIIIALFFTVFVMRVSSHLSSDASRPLAAPIAMGGFAPPGSSGNGQLDPATRAEDIGWTIVDFVETAPSGETKTVKACRFGVRPSPSEDLDFFRHENVWYKLRSGVLLLQDDGFSISPKTKRNYRYLETPAHFKARDPFFLYRVHVALSKTRSNALSPYEYLLFLRANIPSCAGLPLDDGA
ncbi:MAG: hypothetical protein AAGJ87_06335 [Pseudomonadota bacterium]